MFIEIVLFNIISVVGFESENEPCHMHVVSCIVINIVISWLQNFVRFAKMQQLSNNCLCCLICIAIKKFLLILGRKSVLMLFCKIMLYFIDQRYWCKDYRIGIDVRIIGTVVQLKIWYLMYDQFTSNSDWGFIYIWAVIHWWWAFLLTEVVHFVVLWFYRSVRDA